jgi:hypothetical protein
MTKVTMLAVGAVAIFASVQVALVFYSTCHPKVNGLVTAMCSMSIVLYPAIFRYHAKKMKAFSGRTSELPRDSN